MYAFTTPKDGTPEESKSQPEAKAPEKPTPHPVDAAHHAPLAADALFAQCSPSVVQVVVQDRRGKTIATGSGFLVAEQDLIATNYHVIERAHSAHVVLSDNKKITVLGVIEYEKDEDLAILKLARSMDTPPLELAGYDVPPVGTKVYAIGNPHGLANTLSDGLVSGHREDDMLSMRIQTTAPISPGSSGGPLLTVEGRVVGVTTSFIRGGQNLNFAVPVSWVKILLELCKAKGKLTRFPLVPDADDYWSRGYAAMRKLDYDTAIKEYSEAIRLDPTRTINYSSRADAWAAKRNYEAAHRDIEASVRRDPYNGILSYSSLAWFLATWPDDKVRNGELAIELATAACDLSKWKDGFALAALAAAYAEVGKFDEAERYQSKALADANYPKSMRNQLREHLELYRQKKPVRVSP